MIAVVGLSHKTANIEVREKLALSTHTSEELVLKLREQPVIAEVMVVSTCNRVEIIAAGRGAKPEQLEAVAETARDVLDSYVSGVGPYLYSHTGIEAIRHVFRVASSLDSMVLGEPQILGQVKSAYEEARKLGCVKTGLNRVVSHALRTAKRVRTETTLGAGQVSVPSVAIDLARQIFGDLTGHRALLIGSGQMGESAAKLLVAAGASLGVLGRNRGRVEELARELQARPYGFEDLPAQLIAADVIITATSAALPIITRTDIAAVRKKRRGRSLFLIDLAVPRDVDPAADELDGVFLYNVDDLSQIVAETVSSRQREAEAAEVIIERETRSFERSISAEQATPTIVSLRGQLGGVLQAELSRSLRTRLKHLSADDRDALGKMLDSALNKILHPASRHLRQLATGVESQADLDNCVAVLRELFALSSDAGVAEAGVVSASDDSAELVLIDEGAGALGSRPAASLRQGSSTTSEGPAARRSEPGERSAVVANVASEPTGESLG